MTRPDRRRRRFGLNVRRVAMALIALSLEPPRLFAAPARSEAEKIEAMMTRVEAHTELEFIRNGKSYTSVEAARHLRMKYAFAGSRVKTAEDFIDKIASGSSQSGIPYLVRQRDGLTISAADFLHRELKLIEGEVPASR